MQMVQEIEFSKDLTKYFRLYLVSNWKPPKLWAGAWQNQNCASEAKSGIIVMIIITLIVISNIWGGIHTVQSIW